MVDEIKLPEVDAGKIAPGGKILGLPWWGWAVGLVAVVGVVLVLRSRSSGSAFPAAGYPLAPGTADLGSGGGGGGGGSVSTGTSTSTTTNADWLQNVVAQAAQAAGVDMQTATAYLTAYLNGNEPIGSNNALTAFNRVIQAAKQIAPAPNPPSSLTFAPLFATAGQYLTAGIGEIGNVPSSVQNELTNLANGQTTSISQTAANVLTEIEGLYGTFPGLSYTVTPPQITAQNNTTADWQSVARSVIAKVGGTPGPVGSPFATEWINQVSQYFHVPTSVAQSVYTQSLSNNGQTFYNPANGVGLAGINWQAYVDVLNAATNQYNQGQK